MQNKKVAGRGTGSANRLSPHEHYERLERPPDPPFLIASARNVLSNVRCIGYGSDMCRLLGKAPGQLAVVDEEAGYPGRPYHVIRHSDEGFFAEEFEPRGSVRDPQPALVGTNWMVSGTPVLWDCNENDLFNRMISDAADPAHIWKLPRGNHPDASPDVSAKWDELHQVFIETLTSDRDEAAGRLAAAAGELPRENEYLHTVWGVGKHDELIIVIAHGGLEELGRKARELGAKRAICVENGGSVAIYYVLTRGQQEWSPLVRAPNLRVSGTTFVFFRLSDAQFTCLKG